MLNWIVCNRTVYMYKIDLASNNIQIMIRHKTQTNSQTNNQANKQANKQMGFLWIYTLLLHLKSSN